MAPASAQSYATLNDFRWLVGAAAAARLAECQAAIDVRGDGLNILVKRLRTDLSLVQVHLLLEQLELRRHAREKFLRADELFFTRRAWEQATDQWVADYKTGRFSAGQPVADLCCGIGGDLLSLANRGPVLGVDRDPIAALLAETNVCNMSNNRAGEWRAKVAVADVASIDLGNAAAWHIDPDRRPRGRRTTRVELYEPGSEALKELLTACPNAAIKLAPAATFDEPWWDGAELEWISRGRQCRQLVAWFGTLVKHPGQRCATVLRSANSANTELAGVSMPIVAATFIGKASMECPIAPRVGSYVFEPDAAVLAAKLEGALANEQDLLAVAPGVAYYTADHLVNHGALSCFEVLEVMSYRVKPVRQWLSARNIGRLEIKKRGVPLDPEHVRRDLKSDGDAEATILLARIGGQTTAIIAHRRQDQDP